MDHHFEDQHSEELQFEEEELKGGSFLNYYDY